MQKNQKFHRVTADFSPEAYEDLTEIAKRLATTKVDAMRRALGLLYFTLEEKSKGNSIKVIEKNGKKEKEIVRF